MKLSSLIISIFILFVLSSCNKAGVEPLAVAETKPQGYIIVTCDNCKVDYGMPDQYKTLNVAGVSSKAKFSYSTDYNLQVYITALNHAQQLNLDVYSPSGKVVYTSKVTQPLTGFWDITTLLPADE